MDKILKKIGYFILTVLPTVLSLALQVGAGLLLAYICKAVATAQIGDDGSAGANFAIARQALEMTLKYIGVALFGYHLFAIIFFGIWYHFGCGRPKMTNPLKTFRGSCLPASVVMALGLCVFANAFVLVGYYIAPKAIMEYAQMMEAAGMGTDTFSILAAILLAPIGEEILCRGITYHYAKKIVSDMKNTNIAFWIANTLQAAMFGVMHGNLIQGLYAFILGLGLGWLRERYNSLYPAMLAHGVINFSSSYLIGYPISLLPENAVSYSILLVVGVLITAVGFYLGRKPKTEV